MCLLADGIECVDRAVVWSVLKRLEMIYQLHCMNTFFLLDENGRARRKSNFARIFSGFTGDGVNARLSANQWKIRSFLTRDSNEKERETKVQISEATALTEHFYFWWIFYENILDRKRMSDFWHRTSAMVAKNKICVHFWHLCWFIIECSVLCKWKK